MNIGERNELIIKIKLIQMRDSKSVLSGLGLIKSVGFDGDEYGCLTREFDFSSISQMNDAALSNICSTVGISKASTRSKSDVHINSKGFSVKSFESSPPALVNHTARPGFEMACKYVGIDIAKLDKLVDDYWKSRTSGAIGEDIKNSDSRSPFRDHADILKPILEYFLFTGTGSGISKHPADFILDYPDPANPVNWTIFDKKTAINLLWARLIFSVRSKKGMPENYPNNLNKSLNKSVAVWTRYSSGEHRGSLHVRASAE